MRASLVAGALAAAAALAGCAAIPDDQKRNAINEVNAEFRSQYERILAEQGTRFYRVSPEEAFDTLRVTLTRMGMRIGDQSPRWSLVMMSCPSRAASAGSCAGSSTWEGSPGNTIGSPA